MNGKKLGNFDLYYDHRALEQIVIGKWNSRDGRLFFDVWSSFVAKTFSQRAEFIDGTRLRNGRFPD